MTPPKPGSKPGTSPETGAPEKLNAQVSAVAQNPDAYAPAFDVWRVPPNGDGRHMMFVGEIPRASFIDGVLTWVAMNLGAGNFRIDTKDAARLHAGSVFVNNGVDKRPAELRTAQPAQQAPVAVAPAPADSGMTAVLVAMVQGQNTMMAALMQNALAPRAQPDDLDRLVKLKEIVAPAQQATAPASSAVDAMKLGLELGRKLAEKSGAGEFLEQHAKEIFENLGAGIGLLKDVVNKRPTTATVIDQKPQTSTTPPAVEGAPQAEAAPPAAEPNPSEPIDAVLEPDASAGHG